MEGKSATFQFVAILDETVRKSKCETMSHFYNDKTMLALIRYVFVYLSLALPLSLRVHILFGSALNLHILLSCKQMTLKLDNDEQNFFIEQQGEDDDGKKQLRIAAMTMQRIRREGKNSETFGMTNSIYPKRERKFGRLRECEKHIAIERQYCCISSDRLRELRQMCA